jgi:RND family efflux transporter MFP subunit
MPAAGPAAPLWVPEQTDLEVEAVLVPRKITVISSSQDGRIAAITVNHGDRFQKGDLLVAYDCASLRAEADIARIEKSYTEKRVKGSDSLFKLDIISELDRAGTQIEDQKASVKDALYQSRLRDCEIRAEFDGRVTNRLANPGEYTRTDRVLLEVASIDTLQAEFLVPSKWLRWINIGAPVSITVAETERTYNAKIERIHGEVDPVSQSIQMIATLEKYQDPLLPGMSGKATINIDAVRNAGIQGYLETGTAPRTH